MKNQKEQDGDDVGDDGDAGDDVHAGDDGDAGDPGDDEDDGRRGDEGSERISRKRKRQDPILLEIRNELTHMNKRIKNLEENRHDTPQACSSTSESKEIFNPKKSKSVYLWLRHKWVPDIIRNIEEVKELLKEFRCRHK